MDETQITAYIVIASRIFYTCSNNYRYYCNCLIFTIRSLFIFHGPYVVGLGNTPTNTSILSPWDTEDEHFYRSGNHH